MPARIKLRTVFIGVAHVPLGNACSVPLVGFPVLAKIAFETMTLFGSR